ncbi:Alkylated DNA repair dioxygenase AlkB [Chitinophaga sp. CF118]|uniref:alpha-ketoglutarate-dependent dioxygenase AlkB n=1 Tax=Chitinophaga sp. CF118 TaxID=1884367 RepID=UPI0008E9C4DD|nr:alpha-ketoglutarate-dependent dioxygenase AlkB [Chitinophaga sp. CF118]SFD84393.1 Alkylated DNA repair dioxygenase AlkB [Chitinophaga sp. CF118]
MIAHRSLGNTPFEISRNLKNKILSGEIALGGYRKNKIYGTLNCTSGKRMKIENRVFFKNEAEAIANGYRPCAHCLPEKYKHWMQNLLPEDGEVYFYPELFTTVESDRLYELLSREIEWKQEPIFIMGKSILQPRLTAWYGDIDKPYSYSGITMEPHHWTPALLEIKSKIETIAGVCFTSVLLNFYRDGKDSMGWHRDNEKELGVNPVIGSVSFGSPRTFCLKHYKEKTLIKKIPLTHGSFLLMKGSTQHHWLHSIPKQPGITGGRINLTFRVIKTARSGF